MAHLASLCSDLATFAEAVGQPLPVWQADSLAALDHRTTVLVARLASRARAAASRSPALWWAYGRPGQTVLVVSAGEDASRRLLAQAAAVAIRRGLDQARRHRGCAEDVTDFESLSRSFRRP